MLKQHWFFGSWICRCCMNSKVDNMFILYRYFYGRVLLNKYLCEKIHYGKINNWVHGRRRVEYLLNIKHFFLKWIFSMLFHSSKNWYPFSIIWISLVLLSYLMTHHKKFIGCFFFSTFLFLLISLQQICVKLMSLYFCCNHHPFLPLPLNISPFIKSFVCNKN